jgi:hypothetical protein
MFSAAARNFAPAFPDSAVSTKRGSSAAFRPSEQIASMLSLDLAVIRPARSLIQAITERSAGDGGTATTCC